ncbi:septum site-determining protein MinC [Stenoxybacter acetivorans]|uniref:septum site-determining protein MinC n=1 Tax=Stenoxybacter acetivorans TaxID=422441 RepID=UPI000559BDE3|nr:septum site-determining protein MinC [Stenoxybacter acetivorans]
MKTTFEVKSARLDVLSIQLNTADLAQIHADLKTRAARLSEFRHIPFILDVTAFERPAALNLARVITLFAQFHLKFVALRHRNQQWAETAQQHHLLFSKLPENTAASAAPTTATPPKEKQPLIKPPLVIDRPIRTGQQVYAENSDLLVMALVSEGAEILADGNIYVYARLRGRALAGAGGNKNARIFVQSLQAELVSVAGVYRVLDQQLPAHLHHKPAQIYLQEDRLVISAIEAD